MTEFTQLYLTPKIFLMGSSLAFSLKEDPVRCAKVCDKSWVILKNPYKVDSCSLKNMKLGAQLSLMTLFLNVIFEALDLLKLGQNFKP